MDQRSGVGEGRLVGKLDWEDCRVAVVLGFVLLVAISFSRFWISAPPSIEGSLGLDGFARMAVNHIRTLAGRKHIDSRHSHRRVKWSWDSPPLCPSNAAVGSQRWLAAALQLGRLDARRTPRTRRGTRCDQRTSPRMGNDTLTLLDQLPSISAGPLTSG